MRNINYFFAGSLLLLSGCQLISNGDAPTDDETNIHSISEIVAKPDPTPQEQVVEVRDLWQRLQEGMLWDAPNEAYVAPFRQKLLANPRHLEQVFSRAEPFLYLIVDELDRRGLPLELALLPAIESAFDADAISHASASGLWQLTPPMARYFGLKMNWWYDGRNDVVASTKAAADFLEYLYDRTGNNWHYAIAAYNSGEGRVLSAVRHNEKVGKPTDIWALKLPRETRNYVPNLLALADVVKHADKYGVALPTIKNEPVIDVVEIGSQIELALAADLAGLSISELKALNPGFKQWATAPKGPHRLVVPVSMAPDFVVALAQTPQDQRVQWARYQIKRGDSLSVIARQFGTTPQVLKQVNQMKNNQLIAGKELVVPANGRTSSAVQVASVTPKQRYKVKPGDSLWKIAQAHGVSVDDLQKWNALGQKAVIRNGQVLTVWPGSKAVANTRSTTYKVKRGDSLSLIAQKFKVKISELMSWNQLSSSALQPGQTLTVMLQ
ncbi:lytic transglycosylase [Shewanella litorisediminis]|uniref:LysM peptidoglycan-binding domain-containing protein n=1 Tax=Shewanella litorisediminis TaxID=1173586 RepID=A0ABX7FYQ5_9GAMM|nr:LysM peptidoglycan-binding domain-containing protein [Shewanella litorisediminis]MCL2918858.1 LysM peptidoglycan-binding domain-containing protein [Shewanella litorisediminis]QRH00176.1 LysM peptidoglycan-binding domain-containing protein [Shewanella litorisediminis]